MIRWVCSEPKNHAHLLLVFGRDQNHHGEKYRPAPGQQD